MITVLIADDHNLVRKVLQSLLEKAGDIQIVAMASDGREAVEQVVLYRPDVWGDGCFDAVLEWDRSNEANLRVLSTDTYPNVFNA